MLKGYEIYEKLKENVLGTKRAAYELHLCDGHLLPYLIRDEKISQNFRLKILVIFYALR